jgi:hypothetical protein
LIFRSHIINYIYGIPATEIEVTFTQMVMVMNLTTFAWNVHDGRQKADVSWVFSCGAWRAEELTKIFRISMRDS